jgi:hypothetical protein
MPPVGPALSETVQITGQNQTLREPKLELKKPINN